MGRHQHPEVSLHGHCLSEYMAEIGRGNWDGVAKLMLSSAQKLAKAGADFLICPDNTCHIAFQKVQAESPLPWLHIVDVVAAEAHRRGFRTLGITGTKYTMEGPVYAERLSAAGLHHRTPDREERERMNAIIFDELVNARFTLESLSYFVGVISRLKQQGCDAVVLGCTEIPLLVTPENSPLPTLDSTRLLARAAVEHALG
jgi:aspartate racemase